MDTIMKIFGIGALMTVMGLILEQAGRKDLSHILTLAGIIIALLMVIPLISKVLNMATSLFKF